MNFIAVLVMFHMKEPDSWLERVLLKVLNWKQIARLLFVSPVNGKKGLRKEITKVREGERCAVVGKQVHSNLWGPAPVESINWKKYYVSFTDDYSQYTNVYFLTTKDEAF